MPDGSLLPLVAIKEYGVLGTQLTTEKAVEQVAPEPDGETAIVDPAGLQFIQKLGPGQARGAAGAIYEWLGIKADAEFPEPVREAIKAPGQAKFHEYEKGKVIHVVGPDLRAVFGNNLEMVDKVVGVLARAYCNALNEFVQSGAAKLRLLPISGGIFAGRFADDIPWMTFAALEKGFGLLPSDAQELLTQRCSENNLELCVFGSEALTPYEEGLASSGAPPEGGPQVLSSLWPGSLALISGLESEKAQQFNGTLCAVLASSDGKYMVQLENGAKATLPSENLELAEGGVLLPGSPALVSGLESEKAQKFNGTQALLKVWNKAQAKWTVKLEGGITANIPPANLRSLDAIDLASDEWTDLF